MEANNIPDFIIKEIDENIENKLDKRKFLNKIYNFAIIHDNKSNNYLAIFCGYGCKKCSIKGICLDCHKGFYMIINRNSNIVCRLCLEYCVNCIYGNIKDKLDFSLIQKNKLKNFNDFEEFIDENEMKIICFECLKGALNLDFECDLCQDIKNCEKCIYGNKTVKIENYNNFIDKSIFFMKEEEISQFNKKYDFNLRLFLNIINQ